MQNFMLILEPKLQLAKDTLLIKVYIINKSVCKVPYNVALIKHARKLIVKRQ